MTRLVLSVARTIHRFAGGFVRYAFLMILGLLIIIATEVRAVLKTHEELKEHMANVDVFLEKLFLLDPGGKRIPVVRVH